MATTTIALDSPLHHSGAGCWIWQKMGSLMKLGSSNTHAYLVERSSSSEPLATADTRHDITAFEQILI